jgi:hypothetical protein
MAAAADDMQLLLEPLVLSKLVREGLDGDLHRPIEQRLRQAVRALRNEHPKSDRPCILKLNSQMTRFLPQIRRAFPDTPVIWLQRSPAEVVESNLTHPPRPSHPPPTGGMTEWTLRRVTLAFMAATAFVDDGVQVLDYRDLPDVAWARLADLMGFDPARNADRVHDLMKVDAKSGKPYLPRTRQPLSDELHARIRQTLDPLYDALALRRAR